MDVIPFPLSPFYFSLPLSAQIEFKNQCTQKLAITEKTFLTAEREGK